MPGIFSAIAVLIKQLTLLVSNVKNKAFPQPLTEEEEEKHLRLMAEGNDYSRNKLIEHNLRVVAFEVPQVGTGGLAIRTIMHTQLYGAPTIL
jgi:RNA polymerase sporulation-specific sigma factor